MKGLDVDQTITLVLTLMVPRSQIEISCERGETTDDQICSPTLADPKQRWCTIIDWDLGLPLITSFQASRRHLRFRLRFSSPDRRRLRNKRCRTSLMICCHDPTRPHFQESAVLPSDPMLSVYEPPPILATTSSYPPHRASGTHVSPPT